MNKILHTEGDSVEENKNTAERKIVIITAEISNYFRHVSSLKSSNGFFIAA